MGLAPDTEQVGNNLDWVSCDAFKCTDFALRGWSGQFGLRLEQDVSEVL